MEEVKNHFEYGSSLSVVKPVYPLFAVVFLFALSLHASVIDSGPPQDSQGHWEVDLYDASGNQRGTNSTPLYSAQSGTWTTARAWALSSGTDSCSAVQSGTWNLNNISGTISLPTGAATASNQATEITNQGTINSTLQNVQGPVTPGAVASKSALIGGQYNATLPTLTDHQQSALQFDSSGRLITANYAVSALPAASFTSQISINTGVTVYTPFTASEKLGLKQFYAGGTGIGKQTLAIYAPSTTQYLTGGNFESSGDVANWAWTSSAGTGSIAFSTAEHFTGSGSVALTFSNSQGTNAQEVKQTYTTPIDISSWRYLTAEFFNTVSAGGTYTRTLSIIATDSSANTRTYTVSGSSASPPFNASGWIKITGEIENPTSSTGTSFDPTLISSIDLKMSDSANRAGTVYWDTVQLETGLTSLFPIYHAANTSFSVSIDPVVILNTSDQIVIIQKNNDTTRKEFYALTGGVAL